MVMSFRSLPCCALLVAAAFAGGCSDDGKPCDPNQIYHDNLCSPKPPPEAGPPEMPDGEVPDAEVVDGEITDTTNETAPPVGMFGKVCMMSGDSPECAEPAPYCAIQPGGTMGYCTAINCKTNPTVCPANWMCFDVGVLNFCLKPTTAP